MDCSCGDSEVVIILSIIVMIIVVIIILLSELYLLCWLRCN